MKNVYKHQSDGTTIIYLNRNDGSILEAIISTESFDIANSFEGTWCPTLNKFNNTFYVRGNLQDINNKCGRKTVMLHRWIMNPPEHLVVDHINHVGLDNRLENLRIITVAQNAQNRKGAKRNSLSGIRGVSFYKPTGQWRVYITINGKNKFFGLYDDINEAAQVASEARAKYFPFSQEALQTKKEA